MKTIRANFGYKVIRFGPISIVNDFKKARAKRFIEKKTLGLYVQRTGMGITKNRAKFFLD